MTLLHSKDTYCIAEYVHSYTCTLFRVAAVSPTDLSCVSFAPLPSRPSYKPGDEDEPNDVFVVLKMGPPFRYVIPTFDVLAVTLLQIHIRGECDGEPKLYDLFIRSDSSLNSRALPALMTAKDYALIPVSAGRILFATCTHS